MSTILVVAEIQNGKIREASYELAALAQKVGGEVTSLVIGSGVAADAEAFAAAYEDTESERYRALVARIDARIADCDVHRAVASAR